LLLAQQQLNKGGDADKSVAPQFSVPAATVTNQMAKQSLSSPTQSDASADSVPE